MWKAMRMEIAIAWRLQAARRLCAVASSSPSPSPSPRHSRPFGPSRPPPASDPLFRRLSRREGSVGEVMEAWLREKKPTSQEQLFSFVKEFRRYGEHSRSLQLFDWMVLRGMPFTPGAHAVRIDLLAKTQGIQHAEDYFSSLPPHAKTMPTYGALLTSYVQSRMEDKSLSLFSQMRDLNFLTAPLPYNNLMTLYMTLDQPHKIPELFAQMEATDSISPDSYSYSMLARSYGLMHYADCFERVVREVREGPATKFKADWNLHATFASIYISFGKFEQAELELKSLEEKINKSSRNPYHFLITHYAGTGNKEEVNRIWESLRKQFPRTTNGSYLMMLLALTKLDDIDAIKKCFKNWQSKTESGSLSFNVRIPNTVIGAYLKKDMLAEAQVVGDSCVAKGHADSKTVDLFLEYYLKGSKLDLAWNWFEKGVELGKEGKWKPSEEMVNAFVKYFEESVDRSDQYKLFREKLKEIDSAAVEIKEDEVTAIV